MLETVLRLPCAIRCITAVLAGAGRSLTIRGYKAFRVAPVVEAS
jgi:hypothetical protein